MKPVVPHRHPQREVPVSSRPAYRHPPSSTGAAARSDPLLPVQPKSGKHARAYPMSVVPEEGPRELALDTGSQSPQDTQTIRPRRLSRHSNGSVVRASDKIGRPQLESPQAMLQIWLFVECNKRLGGKSVRAICLNGAFPFWTVRGTPIHTRWLRGATLHRRYYEAKAFLQQHIDDHAKTLALFARLGARSSCLTDICDLERYWRAELELEVSFWL